jgi:bifunctional non-homologous end joining protein LigD
MTRNTTPNYEPGRFVIPRDRDGAVVVADGHEVALSNLRKVFWPQLGVAKGDLLQYYADVSPLLVPYLQGRAEVMKRYPNGAAGEYFYMKRTPSNAPPWLRTWGG